MDQKIKMEGEMMGGDDDVVGRVDVGSSSPTFDQQCTRSDHQSTDLASEEMDRDSMTPVDKAGGMGLTHGHINEAVDLSRAHLPMDVILDQTPHETQLDSDSDTCSTSSSDLSSMWDDTDDEGDESLAIRADLGQEKPAPPLARVKMATPVPDDQDYTAPRTKNEIIQDYAEVYITI